MNNRETKVELSKDKIIKESLKEFVQHGYKGASTNSICKNAKISKGLLYHYYTSKENLYLSTINYAIKEFKNKINITFIGENKKGIQYISEYFDMKFRFFLENPLYSRMITDSILNSDIHEVKLLVKEFEEYNNNLMYSVINNIDINPAFNKEKAFELIIMIGEKLEEKHMRRMDSSNSESIIEEFRKDHRTMIEMVFEGIDKK